MAFNRLDGNLDAFAAAIEPGRKTSPQQSSTSPSTTGHRKLAAFGASRRPAATAAAADPVGSSLALGKKLLGTREDWSILQPGQAVQQYFTMDTQVRTCVRSVCVESGDLDVVLCILKQAEPEQATCIQQVAVADMYMCCVPCRPLRLLPLVRRTQLAVG